MLNEKQAEVVASVISGKNTCLIGTAGSGKSYTVAEIKRKCIELGWGILLCGSTGVSVVNVQGDGTLYSIFGLGLGVRNENASAEEVLAQARAVLESANRRKKIKDRLKNLSFRKKVLIIVDEGFMLSNWTLFLAMQVAYANIPLEKIQWLIVGDPMQLPVISGNWIWRDITLSEHKAVNCLSAFQVIYLNEVVRQRGDQSFVEALHLLRSGKFEHAALVNRYAEEAPEGAVHCYFNNDSVVERNRQIAEELITKGNASFKFQGHAYNKDGSDPSKWVEQFYPIEPEMELVIGLKFMIRRNMFLFNQRGESIFVSNGSTGIIRDFVDKYDEEGSAVSSGILIELTGHLAGHEVQLFPMMLEGPTDSTGEPIGYFTQLPGHAAEAATVHKMQGLTIDVPILIHGWQLTRDGLGTTHVRTPAWMYVACSRVVDSSLLFFDNSNGRAGLKRLRASCSVSREALQWVSQFE